MKRKSVHNIVGDIYALQQECDFHKKLLIYLASEVEANTASIRLDDPLENSLGESVTHNFDPKENQKYIQGLYKYDTYRTWLMSRPWDAFYGSNETPELEKNYIHTQYYENSGHISGVRFAMGSYFSDIDGVSTRLGFHRPADHCSFDEDTLILMNTLLPHIKQALSLQRNYHGLLLSQQGMLSIKASETAIFLLSKTDDVMGHNEAAEKLFEQGGLKKKHKSLHFSCAKIDKTFRTLSQQARRSTVILLNRKDSGTAQIRVTLNASTYTLRVEPWQYNSLIGTPETGALLSLKPVVQIELSAQKIAAELKLTLAEAEVAKHVFNGLASQAIAAKRGVSEATVRSQLKSIYSKLDISRATELSKLIVTRVMV